MNKKQKAIIHLVRNVLAKSDDDLEISFADLDEEELARRSFYSYRGEKLDGRSGIRLTRYGFDILRREYDAYEISVTTEYQISARDLRKLSNLCAMPYYIDFKGKKLWFFEEGLAAHARLVDGQISLLI